MKVHFVQNEATPHNNTLIQELAKDPHVELTLWYAREISNKYQWGEDLTHKIQHAHIFGDKSINWSMVLYLLTHRNEKVFQTGWGNPTTRALVILFWLFRRPYNMWFDLPKEDLARNKIKAWVRSRFFCLLRQSKSNIFCVGKMVITYFKKRNFSIERLINLPVLVDTSKSKSDYLRFRGKIRHKYKVEQHDLFIVAGSRLTKDKGYDILFDALGLLPDEIKSHIKTIIIGKGEEQDNLLKQLSSLNLCEQVFMEQWMDVEDYRACIANADVFVHPARFDAYGGGTLNAMLVGTPVLGSFQGGSTVDRIIDGESGWLYDCEDVNKLAELIIWCFNNKAELPQYGDRAYNKAMAWSPERGKDILLENLL